MYSSAVALFFDVHVAATAAGVRIVLNIVERARMVSIAILMLHVILVAFRRAIHLFEKTCIFRVTVRVVRAAQSHGRLELEVAWIGGGKQMLLLFAAR